MRYGNPGVTVFEVGVSVRFYEATSTVSASPDEVWAVLCDGQHWSEWDSGVDMGPLLRFIWRSMPDLGPSFVQFAEGLKHRVESGR
jgi:hypothetical protein